MWTHRSTASISGVSRSHEIRWGFRPGRVGPTALLVAILLPLLGSCDEGGLVEPEPPRATSTELVALPFFAENTDGVRLDQVPELEPGMKMFDDIEGAPILAPDGDHVTWGEWTDARGTILVECTGEGTRVMLDLEGLIPNGVYTLWNVTFGEPGFTGEFDAPGLPANVVGFGPTGPSDGSASAFVASDLGEASLSAVTPPGELGVVGQIGSCALTDEFEWHVVGLYHIDGETYGSERGPEGTRVEHFAFIFGGA